MAQNKLVFLTVMVMYVVVVSSYREELRATLKHCKNGTEVTDGEVEEFVKPLIPKNDEEKCLMACVFRNFNVIENGHYLQKIGLAVAHDLFKNEPEKLAKIKSVVEHCGHDIPKYMENECELAHEIMQCYVKWEKEVGIY